MSEYASFRSRMWAALIDIFVLVIPSLIIIFLSEPELLSETANHKGRPGTSFLLAALWIVYQGVMESSRTQATLGKQVLRIYVTDIHGSRLSFPKAALRCWPMYLPQLAHGAEFAAEVYLDALIYGTVIVPGVLVPIFSCLLIIYLPRNQGAHDWLVGTLVVNGKPGFSIPS